MKKKLADWLIKDLITEDVKLDLKVGDTILMGRFKNKKVKVKSIDYNEKGDLLINGRPALKFRLAKNDRKLLPNKQPGNKDAVNPDADMKGVKEAARQPRKKGQHRNSSSHSDLYTDENPKGTIHGLKFATVKDAKASVNKIKGSGKKHAHKIQAAVAMEQRAKEMGKKSAAGVYRKFINQMKEKTKKKNEMLNQPNYARNVANVPGIQTGGEHRYYNPKTSKKKKKKKAEMAVPSPSRKGVEKMKKKGNTSVPYGSGYKKINEDETKTIQSLLQRFGNSEKDAKKMIKKNYKKVNKKFKNQTPRDKAMALIGLSLLGEKNIQKTLDSYMENFVYSIVENTQIKKVIGIYGGRFQPFGPHHLKTYEWLESKVDEAYITTSDIKKPPRHPMNFAEKVRHMAKMGVPKNRIVKEATPYVAKNTLSKFDPNTTAVVYIFGKKDAGRLQGGTKKSGGKTYYQDYKKNKNNLVGFEEHGYILTAPHTSMSIGGNEISGTTMRNILGSPKIKDEDRPKIFKKLFGYFDKGLYNMMTNKFKKLFEVKKHNDKRELLLMGGAYGHMSHPFDDNDLTFGDLKNIITLGLGGKLDREDGVTEKLDGQNLMISWIDGELKAARNKGHLKNKGATAPNTNGIKKIFAGRGNVEKAFVNAMKDLSRAIKGLSDKQKEKVFGNGTKWMNLEIMFPATANVVDYDVAEIVFHGTLEYDDSGRPIGQPKDSARMLAGMIKQVNANVQKTFRIGKPNFLTVPKSQDFGKKKSKFLSKLDKFKGDYNLSDSDRLSDYHVMYWQEWIMNGAQQTDYPNISNDVLLNLTRRWAFFDKSYKIPDIRNDLKDYPEFLDWVLSTDKNDHAKIFKQNIQPIETLFFEVGAEILKNISGYMAVNPDRTVQLMKKEVEAALKDLKSGGNPEKLKKLKLQIEKLEAIGGVNAIVPTEGVVFKYKGKVYKFTGAFAPINQILGSLKFG